MKYIVCKSGAEMFFFVLTVINLLAGCKGQNRENKKVEGISDEHYFSNIFGEKYYATGSYLKNDGDSVETNLWFITNLTRPMVLYGNYSNGLPVGSWKFGLQDSSLLSSEWSQYKNSGTNCSFSLPFQFNETIIDSNFFRLRIMNDSLGKISIIVGVRSASSENESLEEFGRDSENGLHEKGYSTKADRKEIVKDGSRYFFTEYFMKDSIKKDSKLFHLYGYTPSKRYFVEFTLFHDGPKDDLVKIICNLIMTSLYIGDERFFNPHLN